MIPSSSMSDTKCIALIALSTSNSVIKSYNFYKILNEKKKPPQDLGAIDKDTYLQKLHHEQNSFPKERLQESWNPC